MHKPGQNPVTKNRPTPPLTRTVQLSINSWPRDNHSRKQELSLTTTAPKRKASWDLAFSDTAEPTFKSQTEMKPREKSWVREGDQGEWLEGKKSFVFHDQKRSQGTKTFNSNILFSIQCYKITNLRNFKLLLFFFWLYEDSTTVLKIAVWLLHDSPGDRRTTSQIHAWRARERVCGELSRTWGPHPAQQQRPEHRIKRTEHVLGSRHLDW